MSQSSNTALQWRLLALVDIIDQIIHDLRIQPRPPLADIHTQVLLSQLQKCTNVLTNIKLTLETIRATHPELERSASSMP